MHALGTLLHKYYGQPLLKNVDLNSSATVTIHKRIIENNGFLRAIYRNWYTQIKEIAKKANLENKPIVELGCGASHLEKFIPSVLKTDIIAHSNCDEVVDALSLPYADSSIGMLVMIGVLHHLQDPELFFKEAERVLIPGGRIVLIEPTNSPLHRMMIAFCHPYEYYDEHVESWHNSVNGRLKEANNAIPSIIFGRDRKKFIQKFPRFKIHPIKRHTHFIYYLSGGLSYKPFVSSVFLPLLLGIEKMAALFVPHLSPLMTIEIEKL